MQLSASWLAQVFVQGDFYQLTSRNHQLCFISNESEFTLSYGDWNGSITLKRGFVWGGLVFHDQYNRPRWRVLGLPWQQCQQLANQLTQDYFSWWQEKKRQIDQVVPKLEEDIYRIIHSGKYLKESEAYLLKSKVESAFAQIKVPYELAKQVAPEAVPNVLGWVENTKDWAQRYNDEWLEGEIVTWQNWFTQCESSPLNPSQQKAILLNEDHNLILAGAGSGKTSVLVARVGYLLKSGQAKPEHVLLLAFGRKAAQEMAERIREKLGVEAAGRVKVTTFHQLGMEIIREVEKGAVQISPIATDETARLTWAAEVLREQSKTTAVAKRWQKHVSQWQIANLKGDIELSQQGSNEKLLNWLLRQVEELNTQSLSKKEIQQRLEHHDDYTRLNSELNLVWPFYRAYVQTLKQTKSIDFNGMIRLASQYISKCKFQSPWQYVMVDEYQDISPERLALLEVICQRTHADINEHGHDASLFAVGDDWQAIYRFAGADVSLTTGFEQRFGACRLSHLDTTYRFNSQIGEVANRFVQCNPHQLPKQLNSFKQQKRKAVIIMDHSQLELELQQLAQKHQNGKSVMLLGRNHYLKPSQLHQWQKAWPHLSLEFLTCHASKGREADFVFILQVEEGIFPARTRADSLSSALLVSEGDFLHAEERRLFYVALTRAKEQVWITSGHKPSCFISELLSDNYAVINRHKGLK